MVDNEENTAWAVEHLLHFMEYKGFPSSKETLKLHAKAFCRLVYNRKVWDIIRDLTPDFPESQDETLLILKNLGVDEETNDVDWLMQILIEECVEYPLPPTIRDVYNRIPITPADERKRKYGR